MRYLDNEELLWESENKQLMLTSHRLREMKKSLFGSTIKSMMIEDLISCEMRTHFHFKFLKYAALLFFAINGSVYILNHYLFEAEIIKFFFGDVHLGPATAQMIFNLSIAIVIAFITLFLTSIQRIVSFNSLGLTIDFQLNRLDFDKRESFISKVEEAKSRRRIQIIRSQDLATT